VTFTKKQSFFFLAEISRKQPEISLMENQTEEDKNDLS